jgi:hypothetical protein
MVDDYFEIPDEISENGQTFNEIFKNNKFVY